MSHPDDEDTKEHPPYAPPEGDAPEPVGSGAAPDIEAAEPGPPPAAPNVQPTEPLAPAADEDAQPRAPEGSPAVAMAAAPSEPMAAAPPDVTGVEDDSPTQELQLPTPPSQPSPPPPPLPPSGSWRAGGDPQQWQQTGQQWQGQPPGPPQQWQQPPAGWQQPGQWQGQPPPYPQGWTPQGRQWTGPQYSTSGLVAMAGLLLVLFGLVIAVAGAFGFTQGNELGRFVRDYADRIAVFGQRIDREMLRAFLSAMPSVLVVTGLVQLLVGAGVLAHKGWARWLGALLSILGVLVGVFAVSAALALAPGTSVPMLISIVLLLGYAFVLLALLAGGSHFRARYPGR